MLQDKLNLQKAAEEMGCENCAQAFAALKLANGNRWAAIMLEQVKLKLPVFSTLTDMYMQHTRSYGSHGIWPLTDFAQTENSRVQFTYEDIFPHDGTTGFVRYTKFTSTHEGTKEEIFKMKIGKAVRASLNAMTDQLGEKAIIYITERASSEWCAQQMSENGYELKIDEDFEFIYTSDNYAGHISSCQADADNYSFYELIEGAKAASLLNDDGKILCRAILFTQIHHRNDEVLVVRGIERMYSVDGRLDYKQIFLNRLKADDKIDIYKDFNAGAYDEYSWRDINEEQYREDMYVKLVRPLEYDDSISWMDSFYHTNGVDKCCNYFYGDYEIRKSDDGVTWDTIVDEGQYDEYLEEYVRGVDEDDMCYVYYRGDRIRVTKHTRDNHFTYCDDEDEYYETDDTYYSDRDCCSYHNAVYSEWYDSYIRRDKAVRIHRADGTRDYVYINDAVELEDGGYMLEDELYLEENGIRYKAVEC